jgi:hypothetical protein
MNYEELENEQDKNFMDVLEIFLEKGIYMSSQLKNTDIGLEAWFSMLRRWHSMLIIIQDLIDSIIKDEIQKEQRRPFLMLKQYIVSLGKSNQPSDEETRKYFEKVEESLKITKSLFFK